MLIICTVPKVIPFENTKVTSEIRSNEKDGATESAPGLPTKDTTDSRVIENVTGDIMSPAKTKTKPPRRKSRAVPGGGEEAAVEAGEEPITKKRVRR